MVPRGLPARPIPTQGERHERERQRYVVDLALAMAVGLAACGGDSDNDRPATGGDDGDGFQASPLLVMHNGSGNAGRIDWVDGDLNVVGSFNADANEGIALDLLGNLYAADDSNGAPSRLQACT